MRVWIYGDSLEQIQALTKEAAGAGGLVAGTSLCAKSGAAFPQSGLAPAVSAAIRGKIDLLLLPSFDLLGDKVQADQKIEQFQSYGVSVRSASSSGSSSS